MNKSLSQLARSANLSLFINPKKKMQVALFQEAFQGNHARDLLIIHHL